MISIETLTQRINDRGIKINLKELEKEISVLDRIVNDLELNLIRVVSSALNILPGRVNLNSNKLMVEFFYGYHGLPITSYSKKGVPSLSSDSLKPFQGTNKDVDDYISFRSSSRRASLLRNLRKEVIYGDEIHTNFDCNGALSGRFTSTNPNLQQIPAEYRRFFIARKGYKFLCMDLKQAEPQISYQLAGINIDGDIYDKMSFDLGISREQAKIFNIGVSYGMTVQGISKLLSCSREYASAILSSWKEKNPQLVSYITKICSEAASNGNVSIYDGSHVVYDTFSYSADQYFSNRAFNIHVQGTLAKLIKLAMCDIQNLLDLYSPNSHIVLTEHDELVVELSENSLDLVPAIISKMETIDGFKFSVKHFLSDCWSKD